MLVPLERPNFSVRFASVEDKLREKLLQFPKEVNRLIAQQFDGKKLTQTPKAWLEIVERSTKEKDYNNAVYWAEQLYLLFKKSDLPGIALTGTEKMCRDIKALYEAYNKDEIDQAILEKAMFNAFLELAKFGRGKYSNIREVLDKVKRGLTEIKSDYVEHLYKGAADKSYPYSAENLKDLQTPLDPKWWYDDTFKGDAVKPNKAKWYTQEWYKKMTGKKVDIPEKMMVKYKEMIDRFAPLFRAMYKEVANIANRKRVEYLKRLEKAR